MRERGNLRWTCIPSRRVGGSGCNTPSRFKRQKASACLIHEAKKCFTLLSTNTYLAVTICDRSGMFSGKLFLNVPAELRESWDRKDLSLPLAPKLPILPELSEPFRRSVEGTLPLSEDSTSSVKNIGKHGCDTMRENSKPNTAPDLAKRNKRKLKFLFTCI